MPATITEPAPAKINLFLHVIGRRTDGYHMLDSLAVFTRLGDQIDVLPAADVTLHMEGPFGDDLTAEPDNLVLRATRALANQARIKAGARLTLRKNLPVASGIGGGSADAAATLRALCQLWCHRPDDLSLMRLATALGADVPVCLASAPSRMGGIGDVLSRAPSIPACGIVLMNPGVAVATPMVFKSRQGEFSQPATLPSGWSDAATMAGDLARLRNDLAEPAIAMHPVIADVITTLKELPGCLLARMSGSGATCFGLFPSPEAAEYAAGRIEHPSWWRWGGGLSDGSRPGTDRHGG